MSKTVSILDIGSGKVTVMIGARGVNQTINLLGLAECEYDGFMGGKWLTPSQLSAVFAKVIGEAERVSRSKISHLFVGVPAEFCATFCNEAKIAIVPKRRKILQSDIELLNEQGNIFMDEPADRVINIQPIGYVADGHRTLVPIGNVASSLQANLSYTLCENYFMDTIGFVLSEVGVQSFEFCSSLLAESLYLAGENRRDSGVVLVDCGHLSTGVGVIKGDGLLVQFSQNVGGGHITSDLMQHFFADLDPADVPWAHSQMLALKKQLVLSRSSEGNQFYEVKDDSETKKYSVKAANAIVIERVRAIARGIEKNLCKYDYTQGMSVFLTGGGLSHIKGAKDVLIQETGRRVSIIAPSNPQFNKPELSSAVALLDMVLDDSKANESITGGFIGKIFGKL